MLLADIAVATGEHDGLVIAAHGRAIRARHRQLKAAEIPAQIGATEFVVKGGGADRAFHHDIQRTDDAIGLAVVALPGLAVAGNIQV